MNSQDVDVYDDSPLPVQYVNMSNAVVHSAQGLDLVAKRAIMLALAKTDSVPAATLARASREGWKVRMTAQEYADSFKIDARSAYDQLQQARDRFLKRSIRRMEYDRRGKLIEHHYTWLTGATYHHGEGWVELRFSHEVAPFLLGLRREFTSYQLEQASALRSVYSWRLMECLESWKNTGLWCVEVDKFGYLMEVPPSLKGNYGQMKRRVIEPAIKELRDKNGMDIRVKEVKSGRKVLALEFRFEPAAQQSLF